MEINISGKHIDLGEALQTHVNGRLQEGIKKYIDRVNTVNVVFSKQGHLFRADIHANTGTHSHVAINSRGQNADVYNAFDEAAEKIEKQLRRYKRRLTDHHQRQSESAKFIAAVDYTLAPEAESAEESVEAAPAIIAEKAANIETLSVSEAVMRMDLADVPAIIFFNSANGRLNVVYRRGDGNISWLDPEAEGQKAAA